MLEGGLILQLVVRWRWLGLFLHCFLERDLGCLDLLGILGGELNILKNGIEGACGRFTYHLLRIVSLGLHIIIEVWPHGALGDGGVLIGFCTVFWNAIEDGSIYAQYYHLTARFF